MEILSVIVLLVLLMGAVFLIWGFFAFIKAIFSSPGVPSAPQSTSNAADEIDGMNNGDYYNGPHGYSPMTGYPETQYGSGFDPEAEWNHEEHD